MPVESSLPDEETRECPECGCWWPEPHEDYCGTLSSQPPAPQGVERPTEDVLRVLRSLSPGCWSTSFVWNHGTLQYEDVLSGVVDESRSSETRKQMLLKAVGEMLAKNRQIEALFKRLESLKAVPEGERSNRSEIPNSSPHCGWPDNQSQMTHCGCKLCGEIQEKFAALEAELEAHKHCLSCIDAHLERAGGKMGESNRGEVIDGLAKERAALTAKLAEAEEAIQLLDATEMNEKLLSAGMPIGPDGIAQLAAKLAEAEAALDKERQATGGLPGVLNCRQQESQQDANDSYTDEQLYKSDASSHN